MAQRANIFVEFSSAQIAPGPAGRYLVKMNLYSGPLGRKTFGHLSIYKDIGPLGRRLQFGLSRQFLLHLVPKSRHIDRYHDSSARTH